jgi:hypothetical protein
MPSIRRCGSLVAIFAFLSATIAAAAAPAEVLAGLSAHRAIYDVRLERRSERTEVVGVEGRLVYEFGGSVCEGFTSRFRLVTRILNQDGTSRVTDLRTSSWEEADGRSFDFLNQNFVDARQIEETKGVATRGAGTVDVRLVRPGDKTVSLAPAEFPTRHLAAIIDAAEADRRFAEIDLYDGSEHGERTFRTSVVIGPPAVDTAADADEPAAAASALLAGRRHWPVTISYFALAAARSGDQVPEYQMSFLLYDNGITRRLRLDYGDFVLRGSLARIESGSAAVCR